MYSFVLFALHVCKVGLALYAKILSRDHVTLVHAYNMHSRVSVCCLSSLNVHLKLHIEVVRCSFDNAHCAFDTTHCGVDVLLLCIGTQVRRMNL